MTICPQPALETLRDGSHVAIRPISKSDVAIEREFIEALSPQTRRFRFLCTVGTPSDELLKQLTDIDNEHDAALIAVVDEHGRQREVGVARFSATGDQAEVAVVVSDDWQHKGLGTALMARLIELARSRGIRTLYSVDAAYNGLMREFAVHLGFDRKTDPQDATQVIHTLHLNQRSNLS